MRIICSAGRGEMDHTDCLACALRRDNICGYDFFVLRSMYAHDNEGRRKDVHVTDLTGCLRKAYYSKVEPQPEYPHENLARWMGTAVHGHVEGSDEHLDSELPIAYQGLVGTADVVYKDGVVVDLKTTRWMYVEKLPYGSHSLQVNIYAHMLRKMGREVNRLFIQYIDATGPTKCRKCRVPVRWFDGELKCPVCFQYVKGAHLGAHLVEIPLMPEAGVDLYIIQRKEELEASLVLGMPPEREVGFLCAYCQAREICAPDNVEE